MYIFIHTHIFIHTQTYITGVLTDDAPAGPGGILVDIGDTLGGSISRADVAALCVESILSTDAKVCVCVCAHTDVDALCVEFILSTDAKVYVCVCVCARAEVAALCVEEIMQC